MHPTDSCPQELYEQQAWNKSHLLSLPRDVRLRIWDYVLTDSSNPELLVGIDRKSVVPSYKLHKPPKPEISFFHAKGKATISTNILMANSTIYKEALPILYKYARFMPSDLEGLLPLFLDNLTPFARSCLRHIYICIPKNISAPAFRNDRSKPFFHWAVTCAQVAQLNDTLEQVEVDGEWSVFDVPANRRKILFPLLKIKAAKRFLPCARGVNDPQDYNSAFQELLKEAEHALNLNAKLRAECTKAEALERARVDQEHKGNRKADLNASNEWAKEQCQLSSRSRFKVPLEDAVRDEPQLSELRNSSMQEWCRWAEENLKRMEQDLSLMPGIKQFEKELEEHTRSQSVPTDGRITVDKDGWSEEDWDLIGMHSGASTPKARPGSALSKYSDETWADTASTLIHKDEADEQSTDKGAESDAESGGWEYVD